MKNFPLLFLGIMATLAFSFAGLILSSHIQLGGLTQMTESRDEDGNRMEGEPLYPLPTPGLALQGKQVYIEMGCVYCHSQQMRGPGFGADIDREWGVRQSVPRDYVLQERVLVGSTRTGPDLVNVGNRFTDEDSRAWLHMHLYNPQLVVRGSTMPPFPFLYQTRKIENRPSGNALQFPAGSGSAPAPGYEVVPTPRAEALVEYLLSLKVDYSLPEAQIEVSE